MPGRCFDRLTVEDVSFARTPTPCARAFDGIRALLSGRSVLRISHHFSSVRSADRIYVLERGRIAESGADAVLMAAGGRYAELFTTTDADGRGDTGAVAHARTIVALGGHDMSPGEPLNRFLLELTGAERPRVLFVSTASGDSDSYIVRYYAAFGTDAHATHLKLFGIPPPALRELVIDQDLVFVGGGNTANMLAVWRLHGLDTFLREAWEAGTVLAGVSAGAICWFEAGVTDSFSAELGGLTCLGLLPGSCCPHYDGEETRRPAYHRLVSEGFPGGYAADDLCGLVFRGTELAEAVASEPGARAYRVEASGDTVTETPIEARRLARGRR